MKTPLAERHSYKVGPWRRAFPWLIVGPFLLLSLVGGIVADTAEDRAVGWLVSAVLAVVALGIHALISYAKLDLTTEGLRLRQFGMSMSVPWSNVAGLRLERGCEGFVTHRPIAGRGAANLAALGGVGYNGTPMYNEEQQATIAERRWVPIEAFAWHLRRGTLRDNLAKLAPAVQPLPSLLVPPEGPPVTARERKRQRWWLFAIFCAVGGVIGIAVWFGFHPPSWGEQASAVLFAVVAPLAAWRAGWSARNAFRTGARTVGVLFVFMTLFSILWCLVAWAQVAGAFRGV